MQASGKNNAWGMDVSHYQGNIDWAKVKAAGISFVFVKATQGVRMVDDKLVQNVKGATGAGIFVGVYCFSEANMAYEGTSEAEFLINTLRNSGILDLVNMELVLDLESAPKDGDFSAQTGDAIYRAWQKVIEAAGKKSMLYTGNYFGKNHFTAALANVPVWVAKYSQVEPNDMAGWTSWEFWQYSQSGSVPGIAGDVDMNLYRGSYAELHEKYAPKPQPKEDDYMMKVEDADKLIKLLKAVYDLAPGSEIGRLADELRLASGQPTQNR